MVTRPSLQRQATRTSGPAAADLVGDTPTFAQFGTTKERIAVGGQPNDGSWNVMELKDGSK